MLMMAEDPNVIQEIQELKVVGDLKVIQEPKVVGDTVTIMMKTVGVSTEVNDMKGMKSNTLGDGMNPLHETVH